jgi:hypothetical protein
MAPPSLGSPSSPLLSHHAPLALCTLFDMLQNNVEIARETREEKNKKKKDAKTKTHNFS